MDVGWARDVSRTHAHLSLPFAEVMIVVTVFLSAPCRLELLWLTALQPYITLEIEVSSLR